MRRKPNSFLKYREQRLKKTLKESVQAIETFTIRKKHWLLQKFFYVWQNTEALILVLNVLEKRMYILYLTCKFQPVGCESNSLVNLQAKSKTNILESLVVSDFPEKKLKSVIEIFSNKLDCIVN